MNKPKFDEFDKKYVNLTTKFYVQIIDDDHVVLRTNDEKTRVQVDDEHVTIDTDKHIHLKGKTLKRISELTSGMVNAVLNVLSGGH